VLTPELDSVFVVNSGSEALDIASRLGASKPAGATSRRIFGAYTAGPNRSYEACHLAAGQPPSGGRRSPPPGSSRRPARSLQRPPRCRGAAPYVDWSAPACAAAEAAVGSPPSLRGDAGNPGCVVPPAGYLDAATRWSARPAAVLHRRRVHGRLRQYRIRMLGLRTTRVVRTSSQPQGDRTKATRRRRRLPGRKSRRRLAAVRPSSPRPGGGAGMCRIGSAVLDAIRDESLQRARPRSVAH